MTDSPTRPASDDSEAAPERTASGLDETQLDAVDMEALRAQFRFSRIEPGLGCGVHALTGWESTGLAKQQVHSTELNLAAVGAGRMKLAPLPTKVRTHTSRLDFPRARVHRDLAPALAQPVRRMRTLPLNLPEAELQAVTKALAEKYGSAARQLELEAVFKEVPPEVAKSVRLEEHLRYCQFELPPGTAVAKLRQGYALAVATGASGKTYPVLVRL